MDVKVDSQNLIKKYLKLTESETEIKENIFLRSYSVPDFLNKISDILFMMMFTYALIAFAFVIYQMMGLSVEYSTMGDFVINRSMTMDEASVPVWQSWFAENKELLIEHARVVDVVSDITYYFFNGVLLVSSCAVVGFKILLMKTTKGMDYRTKEETIDRIKKSSKELMFMFYSLAIFFFILMSCYWLLFLGKEANIESYMAVWHNNMSLYTEEFGSVVTQLSRQDIYMFVVLLGLVTLMYFMYFYSSSKREDSFWNAKKKHSGIKTSELKKQLKKVQKEKLLSAEKIKSDQSILVYILDNEVNYTRNAREKLNALIDEKINTISNKEKRKVLLSFNSNDVYNKINENNMIKND